MAGNANSGNVLAFRMSDTELENAISEFREGYGEGQHGIVHWDQFCAFLGYSRDEVQEVYDRGVESKNAYTKRAELLKNQETWVFARMFTTCGKSPAVAIYLSKQPRLDGSRYSDSDKVQSAGPMRVEVSFGGGDARAKKASK